MHCNTYAQNMSYMYIRDYTNYTFMLVVCLCVQYFIYVDGTGWKTADNIWR